MSPADPIDRGEAVLRFDTPEVERALLGKWADVRLDMRERMKDERLHRIPGLGMDEHRERVLGQLKLLVEQKLVHRAFPTRLGGHDDPGGNIAGFEEIVTGDPSLQIKSGVQFGLFGAAVLHLGTKHHHDTFLPDIISLRVPGAFAMTEIGHGSDVAAVGTTATYDPDTEEFVIHTPFKGAWKEYLGNAALHGKAATVFAQLITQGVNHGVHCFYVPIRDDEGNHLEGVGSEDDGLKGGLNGIDNGRLHFTHVRIPRTNLLNRYGDVAPDGTYSSPIESPGRRFFTMLGTLVQGRVSLTGAAAAATRMSLQGAVTYANQRRQFSDGAGKRERVLLDYGRHQHRLIPRIAEAYAMTFAADRLLQAFDGVFSGKNDTDESRQDLETLAAALKPLSTWQALDTIQECREATGGAGFMAKNRFAQLYQDLDIYVTFEGDNNVLLQLVGKRLLQDYGRKFKGLDRVGLARAVISQAAGRVASGSGLRQVAQSVADLGSTARSVEQLRDPDTQAEIISARVEIMVAEIAQAMRAASKHGDDAAAEAFNDRQNDLIAASRQHAELLAWEFFTEALDGIRDEDTKQILTWLRDLYGFSIIERGLGWYLANGVLSAHRAQAITAYRNRLVKRLRPYAQQLVDAFAYAPEHLRMEVAGSVEAERQEEAFEYDAELSASGQAPIHEKTLKARGKKR